MMFLPFRQTLMKTRANITALDVTRCSQVRCKWKRHLKPAKFARVCYYFNLLLRHLDTKGMPLESAHNASEQQLYRGRQLVLDADATERERCS